MRILWFSLLVFIPSVICINKSDVQSEQRRYSVNHPPSAEENNPIPVSVVYKDDVIDVRPHVPKYYDISLDSDVKKKVSTTEGSQLSAPKEIKDIETISKNKSDTEDILVKPTARALGELHIPVAVIYDSLPDNTQNSRALDQEETNIRRRKLKRVSRRKPLQNKTTAEDEPKIGNDGFDKSEIQMTKPVQPQLSNTEYTKPQIENIDSVKSVTPRTKSVKPQHSRTGSANPRTDNADSVKSETLGTKIVNPQLSRAEFVKPQIENEDSVKSETPRAKSVKPQHSRTGSAKPRTDNADSVKSETLGTKIVNPQLSRAESVTPQIDNEDSVKSETPRAKSVIPQLSRAGSAKPQINNDDSVKSETIKIKPINPQLSRNESSKSHKPNDDSFKSETQRTKPAKLQLSRAESVKPPIENEDSVKSDTQSTNPTSVKPQLSRSESVKPRRIASVRSSPANIETTTKVEKTKRLRDPVVPIVEMENYVYAHNGNFHYSYEGGDGTKAHSEGQLRSIDEAAGEAVSGGFSYTDKDGNDFSLSYTADENGYRPIGAHLPTPPPIPPAIARALAYLATATTPQPVTKPSVNHAGRSR